MKLDQSRLLNVVIEKKLKKINDLTSQVIMLEAQLQLVAEMYSELEGQVEKLQAQVDKSRKKEPSSY